MQIDSPVKDLKMREKHDEQHPIEDRHQVITRDLKRGCHHLKENPVGQAKSQHDHKHPQARPCLQPDDTCPVVHSGVYTTENTDDHFCCNRGYGIGPIEPFMPDTYVAR